MEDLLHALETVRPFVFGLLAGIAVVQWRRHRGATAAWAALTFILLEGILIVTAILPEVATTPGLQLTQKFIVAIFALFPYSLYRFTASFKKPRRWVRVLATVSTAAVAVGPFLFERLPEPTEARTGAYSAYIFLFLFQFVFLAGVVALNLWRSGKGLPGVARKRMRTLSLASLALATALVMTASAPRSETNSGFEVAVQLFALGAALLFLIGFAPPGALRAVWRRAEGRSLDEAEAGLMEAQTARDIAETILPPVALLAGGREAVLVSGEGRILGRYSSGERDLPPLDPKAAVQDRVVKVPVGDGYLLIEASEFAPFFGQDEVKMIQRVGFLADLALQRAELAGEQLKIQQQLIEAQTLAGIGSWEWDLDTQEVVWSEQMFHLLGADPATTSPTLELYRSRVHPDDLADLDKEIAEIVARGDEYQSDQRLIRFDGEIINVRSRARTILDERGKPTKMIGTTQDITAESKLEAFRTRFIANAAHELRTPLTSLLGFIDIVTTRRQKMTEEQIDEAFDVMGRSGARLATLVQDMLDLARLQQGDSDVALVPTDVKAAVERSLELVPPPPDTEVIADMKRVFVRSEPHRLDQIFTNLLTNAYKYGGKKITITAEQNDGKVIVAVADDGPGIDPKVAASLFDPFTRGKDSHHIRGSGLGLSIVKMLAESCQGEVRHEPNQPQGARFCLELKAAAPA